MKILLPTDGSDAANEAVDFVYSLAKDNAVDVVVLVVSYEPVQYTMRPWVPEWTEQENASIKSIQMKAKRTLDGVCQSVAVVRESGSSVVHCILDQAKQSAADLIVLGAQGHSAIRRALLGSVSDSVATKAPCSVVVVRPTEKKSHHMQRLLLAFDKSIASREAVTELMQLNMSREMQIRVVSVAQNPYVFLDEGYVSTPITLTAEQIAPISEAAERVASQIAEQFPNTQAITPVADHVGDAIVEAAEKDKSDMILIGDTGHSRIGRFLLGSTSSFVLRHASCSVWISRHHWNSNASTDVTTNADATS